MNNFTNLYLRFKAKYIHNHGQAKFDIVEQKVYTSDKMRELNRASERQRVAPSSKDFGSTLQSIGYFMFANSDTSAMAQMIAIRIWNDAVNSEYELCTEHELYFKGESTLKQWSKFYTL